MASSPRTPPTWNDPPETPPALALAAADGTVVADYAEAEVAELLALVRRARTATERLPAEAGVGQPKAAGGRPLT
jgi:hypothetical protein